MTDDENDDVFDPKTLTKLKKLLVWARDNGCKSMLWDGKSLSFELFEGHAQKEPEMNETEKKAVKHAQAQLETMTDDDILFGPPMTKNVRS